MNSVNLGSEFRSISSDSVYSAGSNSLTKDGKVSVSVSDVDGHFRNYVIYDGSSNSTLYNLASGSYSFIPLNTLYKNGNLTVSTTQGIYNLVTQTSGAYPPNLSINETNANLDFAEVEGDGNFYLWSLTNGTLGILSAADVPVSGMQIDGPFTDDGWVEFSGSDVDAHMRVYLGTIKNNNLVVSAIPLDQAILDQFQQTTTGISDLENSHVQVQIPGVGSYVLDTTTFTIKTSSTNTDNWLYITSDLRYVIGWNTNVSPIQLFYIDLLSAANTIVDVTSSFQASCTDLYSGSPALSITKYNGTYMLVNKQTTQTFGSLNEPYLLTVTPSEIVGFPIGTPMIGVWTVPEFLRHRLLGYF